MADQADLTPEPWASLAERANARVASWLQASAATDGDHSDIIDGVRNEERGLEFTKRLLELVTDSEDAFITALGLRTLSQDLPESLPKRDQFAIRAGSIAALGLPWAVVPLAKRWLRGRLAHLVCVSPLPNEAAKPQDTAALTEALAAISERGAHALVLLDGNAVVGPRGVVSERARLRALISLPEITHVGVDPARLTFGGPFNLDERTRLLAEELAALSRHAMEHDTRLTVDVTGYEHARAAVSALLIALSDTSFDQAKLGVTFAAEAPESAELLNRLLVRSAARERRGALPIEIRITTASTANLETVASLQSGLPVPVLTSRVDREAAFLRLVSRSFQGHGVRTVLATDSPFLIAAALELAADFDVTHPCAVEVRSGVADELSRALVSEKTETRVSLPLVSPEEFGAVQHRIVALAAEAADAESALARQHMLDTEYLASPEERYEELQHLETVCQAAHLTPPAPHRTQDRSREWDPSERDSALFYRAPDDPNARDTGGLTAAVLSLARNDDTGEIEVTADAELRSLPVVSESGFANEPETDALRSENRQWIARQLQLAHELRDEQAAAQPAAASETVDVDAVVTCALETAAVWNRAPHSVRGRVLRRIALTTVAARDRFTQGFAAGLGSPAATLDHAVNTTIDSGRYLAQLAEGLESVRGATFHPDSVALVACAKPESAPTAIHTALAALAAGSAVIVVGPTSLAPLFQIIDEEWLSAGLPADAVQFVPAAEDPEAVQELSIRFARHTSVERAIVLADRSFAQRIVRARPDLRVESYSAGGPGSGVGTALITPSASYEDAANDVIRSAFTGADRALRGVNALLLLGSAHRSERLLGLIADATRAIQAGDTVSHNTELLALTVRETAFGTAELGETGAKIPEADPSAAGAVGAARLAAADFEDVLAPTALRGETADYRAVREAMRVIAESDTEKPELSEVTAAADPRAENTAENDPENPASFSLSDEHGNEAQDPLSLELPPLAEAPTGEALRALTELDAGESWLVQPRKLDAAGLVWAPGVKLGVAKDSAFWQVAAGLPVLGVAQVHSMSEAISMQARIGSGAVASIHSWDVNELKPWLDRTESASLTVNRATVDALIERLPSGSWGRSGLGVTPLLGGPHELVTLGSWRVRKGTQSSTLHLRGLDPKVQRLIELAQHELEYEAFDMVRRAALADTLSWRTDLGIVRDTIGLEVERNLLRYWPVTTHIRAAEDSALDELVRVVAAALLVNAPIEISSGVGLPTTVLEFLQSQGVKVTVERDDDWFDRIAAHGAKVGSETADRLRLIGGDRVRVAEWLGGLDRTALWAEPVTMAGPVELLSLLREQSVSIRAHRHGMAALPPGLAEWLRKLGR